MEAFLIKIEGTRLLAPYSITHSISFFFCLFSSMQINFDLGLIYILSFSNS